MSAVRQLGGNATTFGVKVPTPSQEGEISGKLYVTSNLTVGSNIFTANALEVYGTMAVSSLFTTRDQHLFSAALSNSIAPSLAFEGDTVTGLYRPANQNLGLVTGGSERLRVHSNGFVGIGTTNPLVSLHVNGPVLVQASNMNAAGNPGSLGYGLLVSQNSNAEVSGAAVGIALQRSSNTADIGAKMLFVSDGTGWGRGDLTFELKSSSISGDLSTEVMRIRNNKRVGINTATPTVALDVFGRGIRLMRDTAISTVTEFNLQGRLIVGYVGFTGAYSGIANTDDIVLRYNPVGASNRMILQSDGGLVPAVVVNSNNNVGIRTTVNLGSLTVAGDTGLPKLAFVNDTTTNRHIVLWQNTESNNEFQFIGMGARASELRTMIDAPASIFTWATATSSNSLSELMRLTGGGSLGVGTNNPSQRLHVAGAAQVDTSLFVNTQVIASNSGSATAPSFTWNAESNLGFYRVGTGTIGLTSGASGETVRFTSSNVGIGTGSVNGAFRTGVWGNLAIGKADATDVTYLVFDGPALRKFALVSSNTAASAALSFQIQNSNSVSIYNRWTPLMNLTSNGALCIGAADVTSNVDKFYVNGVARIAGDLHTSAQTIAPANRTATIPSFTFVGSLTSGFYSPAVDSVALSTAATERLRIHSGGSVSIKDTTSTLRDLNVGGSVVIGSTLPSSNWHDSLVHLSTNTGLCGIGLQSTTASNVNACAIANSNESLLLTSRAGSILFYTGSALSSGLGGTERVRISPEGYVGINISSNLSRELEVQNTARIGNRLYQKFVRTLGNTLSNSVEICSITGSGGTYFAFVTLVQTESSNTISKGYYVPVSFDCTAGDWKRIVPTNGSGPSSGNEFDLELRSSGNASTLRIVRTAVGTNIFGSNITCMVVIDQSDNPTKTVTITASSNIGTGVTNTGIYPYTPVSLNGSRQGLGATTFRSKLNVNSETVDNCPTLELGQNTSNQWILDLRYQGSTVLNVQANGSLGIGKTDASVEKLWVEGATMFNGSVTITGQQVQNWGSLAAPAYSFSNSTGTGMLLAASNTLVLGTAGSNRVFMSSNGLIGLHTSNPVTDLHVVGGVTLEGGSLALGQSNSWATVASSTTYAASNYLITAPTDRVVNASTTFTGGVVRAKSTQITGAALDANVYNLTSPYTNPSSGFGGSLILTGGSYINTNNNSDGSVQQFGGDVVLRGGLAAVGTGGTAARAITRNGSIVFQTGQASNINRDGSNFFERARIDGITGFLGVGLSNPTAPLHVNGDILTTSNVFGNDFRFTRTTPVQTLGGTVLVTENSNVRAAQSIVESSAGNVGIGTAGHATYKLDVLGETRMQSRANFSNIHIGATFAHQAGFLNIYNNSANVAKIHLGTETNTRRHIVLYQDANRNNNELQFYGLGVAAATMIYQTDSTSASHRFYAAASSTSNVELMCILGNGRVGIGVTTTTYKLEVAGNVKADNFVSLSDRRVKADLRPLEGVEILEGLEKLKAYEYRRIDQAQPAPLRYGLIAQDVEAIFPHAVTHSTETDLKAVSYTDLVPLLIESIKALTQRVAYLESRLPGL